MNYFTFGFLIQYKTLGYVRQALDNLKKDAMMI